MCWSATDEETIMKRLSGSELARAVIKQQEAQRRAAEVLQTVWKKRKVRQLGQQYTTWHCTVRSSHLQRVPA